MLGRAELRVCAGQNFSRTGPSPEPRQPQRPGRGLECGGGVRRAADWRAGTRRHGTWPHSHHPSTKLQGVAKTAENTADPAAAAVNIGCWLVAAGAGGCWWLLVSSAAAADCGVRGRDRGQRTPRPRSTGGPAHGTRHVVVTTARRGHVPRGPGVWIWCLHHAHVSAASLPSPGQGPGPPTVPGLELETKIIRIRRYAKISQSRRRPLLGPSPG